MNERMMDAFVLVLGGACFIGGFFGTDLRSDVEMPMTDEELADKRPPSKISRAVYIFFGGALFVFGLFRILQ